MTRGYDLEARTREFFEAWEPSFESMLGAFENLMGQRCRWDQRPMILTRSRRQALIFLKIAHATLRLATARVDLVSIARDGDTVYTRRIDHLRRPNGDLIASLPVTGVLRFEDGALVDWREHFSVWTLLTEVLFHLVKRRPAGSVETEFDSDLRPHPLMRQERAGGRP
ncbi:MULTISPECIES: limonene-1,2-epoxide hydrolase family protein [Protofrankia]|uniref:Limonene-12-epoxide hydrolase n=1 Tax=Candidatus Protofrankia datiscae TaxID=2716812 RepID=F8B417_9ACTN|nr:MULTISPECIES: limonene-1,2-epoxide hydrolase family protein [Protofrankia]AEH10033.1 Limonene-12-epoxide hydrolase [Candidatus Protofrankia datiscae]